MTLARLVAGWRAAMLAALVAFAPASLAWEAGSDGLKPIPPLAARVTDLASALSAPERAAVEQQLAAFESASGGQMAVLIVPSTQPEPIEAYAIRVADAWKIGRKGSDNGVLLVVAKDDRRMRLEVGYGYEGAIPDAVARRIIAEDVAPKFRENRYAAGIEAAIARVAGLVKGEAMPAQSAAKGRPGSLLGNFDPVLLIVLLFVVIPAVGSVLKAVLGKVLGSAVGGGIVGAGAFVLGGSILLAGIAALVAFVVILVMGAAGLASAGRRGNGGIVIPGGGWGGGGGFGGGGWSGGGGGFGGGGASGSW